MKFTLVIYFLIYLSIGCSLNKANSSIVTIKQNDCQTDSITMKFKNDLKLTENDEKIKKEYDNYSFDKKDWDIILEIFHTAIYDEEQYDEIKNPNGYMIKITEQDYTITIHCSNGQKNFLSFWPNAISINGKWHSISPSLRQKLDEIISNYTIIK